MTDAGLGHDARDFMKYVNTKIVQPLLIREEAKLQLQAGNYAAATTQLKKLIALEKESNSKSYSDLVRVIYEQGNVDLMRTEGQAYAQKAIELDSKNGEAYLN